MFADTLLGVLSCSAIATTVGLFLCGIPICVNIWRRGSTQDISSLPFIMGVIGASFWLRYGLLKSEATIVVVNVTAVVLYSIYSVFFFFFHDRKLRLGITMTVCGAILIVMCVLVEVFGDRSLDPLGLMAMTLNIVNFGAPLAGLGVVLRKRSTESLPLPMCTANLLVSSQWCLYGCLVSDVYMIIPNAIGMALAVVQLSLFLLFPHAEGETALIQRCFGGGVQPKTEKKISGLTPSSGAASTTTVGASSTATDRPIVESGKAWASAISIGGGLRERAHTLAMLFDGNYTSTIYPMPYTRLRVPTVVTGLHRGRRSGSLDSSVVRRPPPSQRPPSPGHATVSNVAQLHAIYEVDYYEKEWADRELQEKARSAPDIADR